MPGAGEFSAFLAESLAAQMQGASLRQSPKLKPALSALFIFTSNPFYRL